MAESIDARSFRTMFLAGASALDAKKDWINELNVFPVPDGDTGTNMTMTIMSAVKEVAAVTEVSMEEMAKAMSYGALHGARGNSGVILSQLFRGFSKVAREKQELTVPDLAEAFLRAVESAYKAVMKPKEGTILTVARAVSECAQERKEEESMERFLRACIQHGDEVLQKTPEMLPVLKQAGVVDSGGQGLMVVLHGAFDGFLGKEVDLAIPVSEKTGAGELHVDTAELSTSEIRFGYCTEFIVELEKEISSEQEGELKAYLESIGDSIVCVADEDLIKIHVHTNDPGLALQKGLAFGQLSRIKIDNMREEHRERLFQNAEKLAEEQKKAEEQIPLKEVGFVAVAAGQGLSEIFTELGVDRVISGGQTMNPSTEDVLSAVREVRAKLVYVLPNNKNIILAANQAAELVQDREVTVIPTKTVCQGITCMMNYVPDLSREEFEAGLQDLQDRVRTIEVTYAIRDTEIDGVEIHKGDYMALGDRGILADHTDLAEAVLSAVRQCVTGESCMVSLYYGQDTREEEAEEMAEKIREEFPSLEVSSMSGGQPVYYYFISVE